jgi:hypothetical protein
MKDEIKEIVSTRIWCGICDYLRLNGISFESYLTELKSLQEDYIRKMDESIIIERDIKSSFLKYFSDSEGLSDSTAGVLAELMTKNLLSELDKFIPEKKKKNEEKCGNEAVSTWGPLYCDKPKGHSGRHSKDLGPAFGGIISKQTLEWD